MKISKVLTSSCIALILATTGVSAVTTLNSSPSNINTAQANEVKVYNSGFRIDPSDMNPTTVYISNDMPKVFRDAANNALWQWQTAGFKFGIYYNSADRAKSLIKIDNGGVDASDNSCLARTSHTLKSNGTLQSATITFKKSFFDGKSHDETYRYANQMFMHEIGHALGLADAYSYSGSKTSSDVYSVMQGDNGKIQSITDADKQAIYELYSK
jgi:predicted Zn-dependent protease